MDATFATYAAGKNDLLSNFLLAKSIREFAGDLSGLPLKIYVPYGLDIEDEAKRFDGLNVLFKEYPGGGKKYRYAFKPAAASACEADVKTGAVIWMDRHMIVLGPCEGLLLNGTVRFAYRPPHYKIVGVSAGEPLGGLWAAAVKIAGVDETAMFPVYTEVDRQAIWSYFSAGHFGFRAEAGVMGKWNELFIELMEHKDIKPFLDDTARTYLHQIALTLAVLKNVSGDALKPLPALYGYPSHLHNKIDEEYRADMIDLARTAFYWPGSGKLPKKAVSERLAEWLSGTIKQYKDYD